MEEDGFIFEIEIPSNRPWVFLKFKTEGDYYKALDLFGLDPEEHWTYEEAINNKEKVKIISINSYGELQTAGYYDVYPEDKECLYEVDEYVFKKN